MKFEVGDIVISTAGRDVGQSYLVWGYEGNYLILVNGRSKKILNPKKKFEKHVSFMSKSMLLSEKLEKNEKINDAFLRKILQSAEKI